MNTSENSVLESLEGRTYIIGREGHIYISDPAVSKEHAEMNIVDGKIRIRDLDSTNGTYLIENDSVVPFKEGYVSPSQPIAIGDVKCTINSLLAKAGVYSTSKNTTSNFEETKLMPPINKTQKRES